MAAPAYVPTFGLTGGDIKTGSSSYLDIPDDQEFSLGRNARRLEYTNSWKQDGAARAALKASDGMESVHRLDFKDGSASYYVGELTYDDTQARRRVPRWPPSPRCCCAVRPPTWPRQLDHERANRTPDRAGPEAKGHRPLPQDHHAGRNRGLLPVTFRYRDRVEFGEFLDSVYGAQAPAFDGTAANASKQLQRGAVQINGQYILSCLEGWGLDVPLTLDNCIQLAREIPAAVQAVMETYRQICIEGRLGN